MTFLTTTGTKAVITIQSLGDAVFTHPVTNLNLEALYPGFEFYGNPEIQRYIDLGWITLSKDEDGNVPINDIGNANSAENNEFSSMREETLTGAFQITSRTPKNLFLDPGSANRDVNLPSVDEASGREYMVIHTGNSKLLNIKYLGSTLLGLSTKKIALILCSGTDWYVIRVN